MLHNTPRTILSNDNKHTHTQQEEKKGIGKWSKRATHDIPSTNDEAAPWAAHIPLSQHNLQQREHKKEQK